MHVHHSSEAKSGTRRLGHILITISGNRGKIVDSCNEYCLCGRLSMCISEWVLAEYQSCGRKAQVALSNAWRLAASEGPSRLGLGS